MTRLMKGAPVVADLTADLARRVRKLKERGVAPTLAIVRVGERPDDLAYERGVLNRAEKVGLNVRHFTLPESCTQEQLMAVVHEVNEEPLIHGCLMFRPLPAHLDEAAACAALSAEKDVDCATEASLFGVFANRELSFPPCTAEAVLCMLDYYGYELEGKRVTVVGRSLVVGKPVSFMLQARNATVTMCHTRTRDLNAECARAEVLVVAAGHARCVGKGALSAGQVVVDVGINWDGAANGLVGDVDFSAADGLVAAITPVPGGIGAVTNAVLAKHVVEAAERAAEA